VTHRGLFSFAPLPFALLASVALFALPGCAGEETDGAAVTGDESDLKDAEKTGSRSQKWIYQGPLTKLDEPAIVVSLKGHTARVTGLLPADFAGPLPFWAVPQEDEATGRTRITVVYPVATGAIDPSTGTAPAGPGHYDELFGIAYTPTNEKASWGGFPFFKYHMRRGLAFHGPITSTRNAETGDWEWTLRRGPVSHGCERMQGEHVVELTHLLGVDMSKPHSASETYTIPVSVDVIPEWDTYEGQYVDVDYPALPEVQRPTENVWMFPTWDSRNLPQIVCAYDKDVPLDGHHCDDVGLVQQDMISGKLLYTPDERPWIGDACTSDDDCGFQAYGVDGVCRRDGDVGYCTVPCEGYCPDRAGEAPTFCGTVGSGSAARGTCMAKAAPENDGCFDVEGTAPRKVERFVGSSSAEARVATVCTF
jgi:hypothetical protein